MFAPSSDQWAVGVADGVGEVGGKHAGPECDFGKRFPFTHAVRRLLAADRRKVGKLLVRFRFGFAVPLSGDLFQDASVESEFRRRSIQVAPTPIEFFVLPIKLAYFVNEVAQPCGDRGVVVFNVVPAYAPFILPSRTQPPVRFRSLRSSLRSVHVRW